MKGEITFGLVHGSWHGAWCWELLQTELDAQGYKSVAMDLPIDNPQATFDDYADVVVDHLKTENEVVLVGHSRAGNIIPRAAGRLATRKLLFLNSTFEPATIGHPTPAEKGRVPVRNSYRFQNGIIPLGNGLTRFDPRRAKQLFFYDCSDDIQDWAVAHMRPQRRFAKEPGFTTWPELPKEYILSTKDRVVNPRWSRYVAQKWLNIEPKEFESGHSPFLSHPAALARLLILLAEESAQPEPIP